MCVCVCGARVAAPHSSNFFRYIQGRDNCRLDPATSIQELKYAAHRALPVLESGTVFSACL